MALIEIRPAAPGDLAAIDAIQRASPEAARWNASEYLEYNCILAVVDKRVVGFLVFREAADEREILNLAVDPGFRRRGVAAALLRAALRSSPGRWFLEVRESNRAARELYRKAGFVEAAVRPDYYETPPEHAIVLKFFS
jgi:ribosomal-protein-alanine N-acetyltransferase